jgi:hypothetical protein
MGQMGGQVESSGELQGTWRIRSVRSAENPADPLSFAQLLRGVGEDFRVARAHRFLGKVAHPPPTE